MSIVFKYGNNSDHLIWVLGPFLLAKWQCLTISSARLLDSWSSFKFRYMIFIQALIRKTRTIWIHYMHQYFSLLELLFLFFNIASATILFIKMGKISTWEKFDFPIGHSHLCYFISSPRRYWECQTGDATFSIK